ncbi:MAG: IclR family transcriptional regulator [Haliea sp.]|nr:MAG: IclR family transcriptional regulator [Haliea sp.]
MPTRGTAERADTPSARAPRAAHRTVPAPAQDGESAQRGTQTLGRALCVLKAFGGHAGPLANAELVRRTGFSKASISRITATLVALGYLDRASDGVRFQIGMRGPMLGQTYRANSPVSLLARPVMQAFADRHDTSVALAVGDGTDVLYIEYCKSPRIATLRLEVGNRMPMEVTSIGRAYLWAQPPQERERLLGSIRQKCGGKYTRALQRTDQAFEHLARLGYCMANGEYQRDAYGISVPVHLGQPAVPLALNCGTILPAPDDAHIRDVLVPDLLRTARALEVAMAGVDGHLI